MFRGHSTVNLDAKGRLAVPTCHRQELIDACGGEMVLTVHGDSCLMLFPTPEWEELERRLMRLPNQDAATRRLQRMLMGHATEVEMDGHGRILIPPRLREFANLDKRVAFNGMGNKFEIWNEQTWEEHRNNWRDTYSSEDLPEPLANLLI